MPKVPGYTPEFKDQAVRLVVAEQGPDESRRAACERLAPRISVNPTTLYGWVKQAVPRPVSGHAPGSLEELRAANAQLRKENRELARANADLAGGGVFLRGGARPPVEAVASFVIAHQDRRTEGLRWGFEPICRVLGIPASTVRSHLARPVCARRVEDEVFKIEIRRIFDENYQVYGVRKIRAVLLREGTRVAKNRVSRLMRELGIRGVVRGRKVRTTIPDLGHVRAEDLVNRVFSAPAPNRLWVMDFTYVPTWAGMVYVAFVIDVFSRMIVGWHLAINMRAELVMTALEHAIWRRDTLLDELIAHSDAGSQGNTPRSGSPTVSSRSVRDPRSAASAIRMTMLSPRV